MLPSTAIPVDTADPAANGAGPRHGGPAVGSSQSVHVSLGSADGRTRHLRDRYVAARNAEIPRTLDTREWLARAVFLLLAVTTVLTIVLVAVGLLGVGDAAQLALPVVAIAALVLGVYLGAEPRRRA